MHTSVGRQVPSDLVYDIEHFKGSRSRESSISTTPDGLCTPPSEKKVDYFGIIETPTDQPAAPNPNHGSSNKIRDDKLGKTNVNTTNTINNDVTDGVQSNNFQRNPETVNGVDQIQIPLASDPKLSSVIREIPKSPHLSKDFSPNGDRIRNSIRARRQERMLRQRSERNMSNISISPGPSSLGDLSESSHSSCAINEPNSDANGTVGEICAFGNPIKRQRTRPYGEKGFILNRNDGLLSLNDVKNLDNCSDFDSSCDTSLNYIDVNNDSHSIRSTSKLPTTSTIVETTPTTEAPPIDFRIPVTSESSAERKNALEEIKRQLNLCKTKLEALEVTDPKPQSPTKLSKFNNEISLASLPSVCPPKKHENGTKLNKDIDLLFSTPKSKSPTKAYSMFSRLNPLSPIFSSKQRGKVIINETYPPAKYPTEPPKTHGLSQTQPPPRTSRLFRINDTPIFERRKIHSLLPSKLFKRSDSDDNIMLSPDFPAINPPKQTDNDTENVQHRKNGRNTSNQCANDRTSPIRKYFSMNQPKIQSKPCETAKLERVIKNDQNPRQKFSKPLSINPMKYSVKKSPAPTVRVHGHPNAADSFSNMNYGKPKHVFVNCMDPGCSTSAPHPIGLQEKSSKFSSLFDYDNELQKMANDSNLYRIRNADKPVAPSVKMPPPRKSFRN